MTTVTVHLRTHASLIGAIPVTLACTRMRLDDALRPLGGGAMRLAIAQPFSARLRVYVVATPSTARFKDCANVYNHALRAGHA